MGIVIAYVHYHIVFMKPVFGAEFFFVSLVK